MAELPATAVREREFRVQRECMCPKAVKDVRLGGEEAGGMMKLGGRGVKIPDLWRRSAFEEICLDHQGRAIPRGKKPTLEDR